MMALLLRVVLFILLYQFFRSLLRKPKSIQTHRTLRTSRPVNDERIVEAEYRVIKE